MECNNWIQNGMLYASDELSSEEKNTFETHMQGCTLCQTEYALYQKETTMFGSELLLESTTPEIDAAVRAACMKIPRPSTSVGIFSAILRKSTVSALFIILGLGVPVYFAFNVQNAKRHLAASDKPQSSILAPPAQPTTAPAILAKTDTILDDSSKQHLNNAKVVKPMGNLYEQGVVPVDVKNE
jgi:anti-sigma factor RsiW